ncbi:hypothetical protein OHD51_02565 [Escherichia coli]|nr:hypothetical protein [Escherichia coli]
MRFLEKLNNTDIELTALTVWIARKTFALNRVEFYEALGGMIRDGTPSLRALEFLCKIETDFEKKGHPACIFWRKCIDSIKSSGMLSGALPTWVPPEEATFIRTGKSAEYCRRAFPGGQNR